MDISFPAPVPYEGDEGVPGSPGRAFDLVTLVLVAVSSEAAAQEEPSTRRSRPPVYPVRIRLGTGQMVALIRAHIRLGTHPGPVGDG